MDLVSSNGVRRGVRYDREVERVEGLDEEKVEEANGVLLFGPQTKCSQALVKVGWVWAVQWVRSPHFAQSRDS